MLKLHACKAIIDHFISFPEIFGKAMNPKPTKKGYIESGLIDKITDTYPNIVNMLKNCKLQYFKKEYENIVFTHFSVLCTIMKTDGYIPEEVYERLGLCPTQIKPTMKLINSI